MPSLQYSVAISGGGLTQNIARNTPRTADGGASNEVTVPKGFAGQLTTRTDNETGTLTMEDGHGITTGQIIDLYWDGGSRHEITVGTVSSNTVPIGADDSGTGDNLPTNLTDIVASPRVTFNAAIDGDALSLLGLQLWFAVATHVAVGQIEFYDAEDDLIATLPLTAMVVRAYDVEGGDTNPFTGDPIAYAIVSQGSTTYDAKLLMAWIQDVTP